MQKPVLFCSAIMYFNITEKNNFSCVTFQTKQLSESYPYY